MLDVKPIRYDFYVRMGYLYINMIFTSFVFHTKIWKRSRERKAYLLYHEVLILEKIRYCA